MREQNNYSIGKELKKPLKERKQVRDKNCNWEKEKKEKWKKFNGKNKGKE